MSILSGLGARARGLFIDTKGPWGPTGGDGNEPPPEDSGGSGPWGEPPKRGRRATPPPGSNVASLEEFLKRSRARFGNGGGFDNGLNFTLSMGCGTWGGNSITDNLNYMNFLNITHLVTTIPEDRPSEEQLFGAYWKKYGK